MAAPVDSQRLPSAATGGTTTLSVSTGSPSAGDWLIVLARWGSTITGPSIAGFSDLYPVAQPDASGDSVAILWKIADGTEGADETLSWTTAVKCAAICWVVTGADPASTPDISTVAVGTGANSDPGNVAVTSPPKDVLYLALTSGDGELIDPSAQPSGYSNLVASNTSTAGAVGTNCMVAGASLQATGSSSENPGAFTSAAPSSGWAAWTVAIQSTGLVFPRFLHGTLDTFNRANENPIASPWTGLVGEAAGTAIVSNAMTSNPTNDFFQARHSTDFTLPFEAIATYSGINASVTGGWFDTGTGTLATRTGYSFAINDAGGGLMDAALRRENGNGTATDIASNAASPFPTAGDRIGIQSLASGDISVWIEYTPGVWTAVLFENDTTYTSGKLAFGGFSTSTTIDLVTTGSSAGVPLAWLKA